MGTMDEMGGMDHGVSAMEIRHVGEFLEVKVCRVRSRVFVRRRLRRRPAPPRVLTPKSATWKAPGSDDSGAYV